MTGIFLLSPGIVDPRSSSHSFSSSRISTGTHSNCRIIERLPTLSTGSEYHSDFLSFFVSPLALGISRTFTLSENTTLFLFSDGEAYF